MKRPRAANLWSYTEVKYISESLSVFWTWRDKWKGLTLPRWFQGRVDREPPCGHPREILIVPKRPEGAQGVNGVQIVNAALGTWSKSYPQLAEWLCVRAYDDGKPVGDVRMVMRVVGGMVICELKVQDGPLKLTGRERSPDLALAALEALLRADPCPWEVDEWPIGRRDEKKKSK